MLAFFHCFGSWPSLQVLFMKFRITDSEESVRLRIISLVRRSGPGAFLFLHFFTAAFGSCKVKSFSNTCKLAVGTFLSLLVSFLRAVESLLLLTFF